MIQNKKQTKQDRKKLSKEALTNNGIKSFKKNYEKEIILKPEYYDVNTED